MKYLLACPSCGTKNPVETGQAGQSIRCSCGNTIEVPSIRAMRSLEAQGEEVPTAPRWSTRQGLIFLGLAITAAALVVGASVLIARPAVIEESDLAVKVDDDAIRREVQALSPTDAFIRYDVFASQIPLDFADHLKKKEVPTYLWPGASLLAGYEDKGSFSLAPKTYSTATNRAIELRIQAAARAQTRRSLNDWLWLIAAVGIAGLAMAIPALLSQGGRPIGNRRPSAA
jgi:hypothetical protein